MKKFNLDNLDERISNIKDTKKIAQKYYEEVVFNSSGAQNEQVVNIPVSEITPYGKQPRRYFNDAKFEELKESIREVGLINPIIVANVTNEWEGVDTKYVIIAGERRWRAFKDLGRETIPAIVRNFNRETADVIAFLDNVIRENLHFIDEAEFYASRLPLFNNNQTLLAKHYKMPQQRVSEIIALAKLSDDIKQLARQNENLTFTKMLLVTRIGNEQKQRQLINLIATKGYSLQKLEEIYKKMQIGEKRKKSSFTSVKLIPNRSGFDMHIKFRKDRPEDWEKIIKIMEKKIEEVKAYLDNLSPETHGF